VTEEEADNLYTELYVCLGARIILTTNLWTEVGLVNGAMGSIHDIAWDTGKDPTASLLSVIMVKFDEYKGPDFPGYEPGIVPVFLVTRSFEYKGSTCSCTQFPL
jgi:ATP-dependent DNA helicase PIF1